jgi:hypothetical protein
MEVVAFAGRHHVIESVRCRDSPGVYAKALIDGKERFVVSSGSRGAEGDQQAYRHPACPPHWWLEHLMIEIPKRHSRPRGRVIHQVQRSGHPDHRATTPLGTGFEAGTYLYTVSDLKVAFDAAHAPLDVRNSDRSNNPGRAARAIKEAWAVQFTSQDRLAKIRDQLVLRRFAKPGESALAMQRRLLAK